MRLRKFNPIADHVPGKTPSRGVRTAFLGNSEETAEKANLYVDSVIK